jgi:hypothetical protein
VQIDLVSNTKKLFQQFGAVYEMIICLETNPTCQPSDQEVPKTMEEKLCIEKEGLLAKELLEEGFPKGKPPGKGFLEEGLWRYTR